MRARPSITAACFWRIEPFSLRNIKSATTWPSNWVLDFVIIWLARLHIRSEGALVAGIAKNRSASTAKTGNFKAFSAHHFSGSLFVESCGIDLYRFNSVWHRYIVSSIVASPPCLTGCFLQLSSTPLTPKLPVFFAWEISWWWHLAQLVSCASFHGSPPVSSSRLHCLSCALMWFFSPDIPLPKLIFRPHHLHQAYWSLFFSGGWWAGSRMRKCVHHTAV